MGHPVHPEYGMNSLARRQLRRDHHSQSVHHATPDRISARQPLEVALGQDEGLYTFQSIL